MNWFAGARLMVDFLSANSIEENLARHVKPRRPFRRDAAYSRAQLAALNDIEDVSRMVRQFERDSKGVPVLLKQYLKLGGRLLAFSADSQFNDALDGLIMVDLLASNPRVLARYMGKERAATFLARHGIGPGSLRRASWPRASFRSGARPGNTNGHVNVPVSHRTTSGLLGAIAADQRCCLAACEHEGRRAQREGAGQDLADLASQQVLGG